MAKQVILVGTPGVGKSALLNTLIGAVHFPSGIHDAACANARIAGGSLTRTRGSVDVGGVRYTDTPGLHADCGRDARCDCRAQSAREVAEALSDGGQVRLVFVLQLGGEGGLRPADLAAMTVVLDAVAECGVDVRRRYAVVINKVRQSFAERVGEHHLKSQLRNYLQGDHDVGPIFVKHAEARAEDVDNVRLRGRDKLALFVANAPIMSIPRGASIRIHADAISDQEPAHHVATAKMKHGSIEREGRAPFNWDLVDAITQIFQHGK